MIHALKIGSIFLATALAVTTFIGIGHADDTESDKAKKSGAVTTLWEVSKTEDVISVLPQGKIEPIKLTIKPGLVFGGVCIDCQLFQQFKASEPTGICDVCQCAKPNVECIAWKPVKPATWQAMLLALPRGVALRVAYNEPDKPESGLKTLTVDRRTVLLPVDGLSGKTKDQLQDLVKPIGGEKAELAADGKQLLIDLKKDWTLEREAKFEKTLSDNGAKLTYKTPEEAKK